MKWKAFQRDDLADVQPGVQLDDSDHPLASPVAAYLPHAPPFASVTPADIPFATASYPSNTVRGVPDSLGTTLPISRDIEALLKEDEKKRGKEVGYSGSADSSMEYPAYEDSGVPIIGLPAPPRGPRKSSPRERRQSSKPRIDGPSRRAPEQPPSQAQRTEENKVETIVAQDNDDTLISLSAFGPANALRAPAIGDLAIDNIPPLEIEVMTALNSRQSSAASSSFGTSLQKSHAPSPGFDPTSIPEDVGSSYRVFSLAQDDYLQGEGKRGRDKLPGSAKDAQQTTLSISTSLLPTRAFLTHSHNRSRDSDVSHTTLSSLEPASTTYEPRISISSTIYPSSACNSLSPGNYVIPSAGWQDNQLYDHRASSSIAHSVEPHTIDQEVRLGRTSLRTDRDSDPGLVLPIPTGPETLLAPKFADREDLSSSDNSPIDFGAGSLLRRDLDKEVGTAKLTDTPRAGKPALPTAPKPTFRRSRSVQPVSKTPRIAKPPSPTSSPKLASLIPYNLLTSLTHVDQGTVDALPPTTNYLNAQERADLVRKTRKLTQLFGRTPSPITSGVDELTNPPGPNNCLLPMIPTRKIHTRGALSTSDALQVAQIVRGIRDRHDSPLSQGRGKSTRDSPLSPMTFRSSFLANEDSDSDASLSPVESPAAQTPESSQRKHARGSVSSPAIITAADSFMDMAGSEQEALARSPSAFSMTDSLSDSRKVEDERRRKRERLSKLHRFLGSRIPPELILGPHEMGVPLPPLAPKNVGFDDVHSDNDASSPARIWARNKRRNSLASSDPTHWLADSERMKEDLNGQQKALIVKRAQKMEKVFGEQPPLNLFHNRQPAKSGRPSSRATELSSSAPTSPVGRNINKSAYRKSKNSRWNDGRPGTAESRKGLITSTDFMDVGPGREEMSQVYLHYRHSLISLTNIIDNDDRRSLAELHEYINGDLSHTADRRHKQLGSVDSETRVSSQSERRRSLPHQSSLSSLASQYTITEGKAEASPFEVRRRRAAKLSHFFGVSYRDLFGEVLDSIEMGVREDEVKGTLNPDEAQDLLAQLRRLKSRRDDFE